MGSLAPRRAPRLDGRVIVGHESPHKFDQFSLDHMGRGEGAQAYSKGLYFWENPSVGKHYHDAFEHHPATRSPEWDEWNRRQADQEAYDYRDAINRSPYSPAIVDLLQQYSPIEGHDYGNSNRLGRLIENRETYQDAFARLFSEPQRQQLTGLFNEIPAIPWDAPSGGFATFPVSKMAEMSRPYYTTMYDYLGDKVITDQSRAGSLRNELAQQLMSDKQWWKGMAPGDFQRGLDEVAAQLDRPLTLRDAVALDRGRDAWSQRVANGFFLNRYDLPTRPLDPGPEPKRGPFTYHANLNADRSAFPDLNTPLAGQPPQLRDALLDFAHEMVPGADDFGRGMLSLETIRRQSRGDGWRLDDEAGSKFPGLDKFSSGLRERGVPGVRYDDFSRSTHAPDEGRTQNFVVYDPSIIEIVKRYPYSLLAPLLMSGAASQQEQPVQSPLAGSLLESF